MMTAATIANASRLELLCFTYELFLESLIKALGNEGVKREQAIMHAREILVQLVEGLDFKQPIAQDLFKVYIYIQNLLINKVKEDDKLNEAYRLMQTIYKSYEQLLHQDGCKRPVMDHVENIYAGMTYSKGYLSEMVVGSEKRGYKA